MALKRSQLDELLYQALETERGGQGIYKAAIANATTDELREEWQKYLEETEEHERILLGVFEVLGLDPSAETPGSLVVRGKGEGLVKAMETARANAEPAGAELVAAECVVEAETKDHQNWELIGRCAEAMSGKEATALQDAYEQVHEQEAEHLFHTMGWARELWIKSLGMPAVIPPPEEEKSVTTQIGAARAEQQREKMLDK